MIAMLCHHFGLEHIEIAEDIIGETFLKASENWAITVVPARFRWMRVASVATRGISLVRRNHRVSRAW